jgi:hypothetical protein
MYYLQSVLDIMEELRDATSIEDITRVLVSIIAYMLP